MVDTEVIRYAAISGDQFRIARHPPGIGSTYRAYAFEAILAATNDDSSGHNTRAIRDRHNPRCWRYGRGVSSARHEIRAGRGNQDFAERDVRGSGTEAAI